MSSSHWRLIGNGVDLASENFSWLGLTTERSGPKIISHGQLTVIGVKLVFLSQFRDRFVTFSSS